ncbi:MAG TPA: carboxypeptidase-like regulatory domain-containing protein [Kofleriaceae bacterium]|jgi:hypothetical protein|nr:carboxypeptidase-like regulatory domain-containing protein [Kofleriaceae bacterium]
MKAITVALILTCSAVAHAGDGTLVIEVAKADGHAVAADCEVRAAGAAPLLKKLAAGTGVAQTGLAGGSYDVACTARLGGLTGSQRVTVTAGKTGRFKVTLAGAPSNAGLTGKVTDGSGKPLSGKVEIVFTLDVSNGVFDAGSLPPGRYTVRFQGGDRVQAASQTVTVTAGHPAQVNLRVGTAGMR